MGIYTNGREIKERQETKIKQIANKRNYIVLASDGMWDFIREDEIHLIFIEENFKVKKIVKNLTNLAKQRGSQDDISCFVTMV